MGKYRNIFFCSMILNGLAQKLLNLKKTKNKQSLKIDSGTQKTIGWKILKFTVQYDDLSQKTNCMVL
jgi:hypothetical protein